jgi:hypothetical protein
MKSSSSWPHPEFSVNCFTNNSEFQPRLNLDIVSTSFQSVRACTLKVFQIAAQREDCPAQLLTPPPVQPHPVELPGEERAIHANPETSF